MLACIPNTSGTSGVFHVTPTGGIRWFHCTRCVLCAPCLCPAKLICNLPIHPQFCESGSEQKALKKAKGALHFAVTKARKSTRNELNLLQQFPEQLSEAVHRVTSLFGWFIPLFLVLLLPSPCRASLVVIYQARSHSEQKKYLPTSPLASCFFPSQKKPAKAWSWQAKTLS